MTTIESDTLEPNRSDARLARVYQVIDEVIAPQATSVNASSVPRSHLEALAATGLFGWTVPVEHGGEGLPRSFVDEVLEYVAGACPSTYLLVSQHFGPIDWILRVGTAELLTLLPDLIGGKRIGVGAFGHVRSWPQRRSVVATRAEGGWRFDGNVPWLSGWGVGDIAWAGAIDESDERVVFALIDLDDSEHIVAQAVPVTAVAGSRTVALELSSLWVPDERVVHVESVSDWKAKDGVGGPPLAPGALGLARAALQVAQAKFPDDAGVHRLIEDLELLQATASSDAAAGPAVRAASVNLAVRATQAALVARGGASFLEADIDQIRAQAASFLQVRGLSPRVRQAHLRELAGLAAGD